MFGKKNMLVAYLAKKPRAKLKTWSGEVLNTPLIISMTRALLWRLRMIWNENYIVYNYLICIIILQACNG